MGCLDSPSTTCYHKYMSTVNPLRLLREAAGETVSSMAELASVTPQLVIWNEQGVYTSPSPRYLSSLLSYSPHSELHVRGNLDAAYSDFQKLTRKANYGKLLEPYTWTDGAHRSHPFVTWRQDSGVDSRVAISKLYCLHPATVFKFERQPERCKTVPSDIYSALLESGYKLSTLEALSEAFENHRKYLRSTR